jgi:hypothetical protein
MKIKAYCLCLPQRESLWLELQKQVEALGVEFKPFIVGTDHIDLIEEEASGVLARWDYGQPAHKLNHYNAYLCHQKIIQSAIADGVDYVWILEDDCYLLRRFMELGKLLWDKIAEWLELELPAMLYLGYWWYEENYYPILEEQFKINHDLTPIKVRGNIGGLHSVLIHKDMFDFLLDLPPNNPWDRQLNLLGHNNLNSWMMNVKLCGIRSCWSFCEGSFIERKEII